MESSGGLEYASEYGRSAWRDALESAWNQAFRQCSETILHKANTTWICGADPADAVKKSVGAATRGRGAKRRNERVSAQEREANLDLDLPPLTDSYRFAKGKALGILKQAIHMETRQRRAVFTLPKKSIIQALPPTDDDRLEVLQHLQKLLRIDHVNILTLHEACEDERNLYLIYDWPEGGLLLHYLTQFHEDITEGHLASVARSILAALVAAGRFSIYHHDWSLLCLFLQHKHRLHPVKVFGLGLAGVLLPLVTTRNFSRSNKHFYVSPELIDENYRLMNHAKLHACDIWSVGTLLYMLFSGRPPFCGTHEEVVEKIRRRHWGFGHEFDTVSREAKEVMEKMIHKKWEARPTAVELLGHPFMGLEIGRRRQGGVICLDALAKLEQFARETHCRQTLARLLADLGLQEAEYGALEDIFRMLDLDGSGTVEVSEIEDLANRLKEMDRSTILSIVQACDRNDNQSIDISEFVAALIISLENKDERLLIRAFEKMDMNRDARITKGEVFRVLRQYSGNLEPQDVSHFVTETDKDYDKKIDYNEFKFLFPHIKERDEGVKARMRNLQLEKETRKRSWGQVLASLEKFLRTLRTAAGRLALEFGKMQRAVSVVMNEKSVQEKIREMERVLADFAEKVELDPYAQKGDEKEDRKHGLTGLVLMQMYNFDTDLKEPSAETRGGGGGGRASPRSAGADAGGRRGSQFATGHRSSQAGGMSPRGGGDSDGSRSDDEAPGRAEHFGSEEEDSRGALSARAKSIAEIYVIRATQFRGKSREDFLNEVKRRRRWLWIGSGEGLRHTRAHILALRPGIRLAGGAGSAGSGDSPRSEDDNLSPRSDHSQNQSPRSEIISPRDQGASPRLSGRLHPGLLHGTSQMMTQGHSTTSATREEEHDSDSDGLGGHLVPWSANAKKMKHSRTAMDIAGGPKEVKIGNLAPQEQVIRLRKIARRSLRAAKMSLEVKAGSKDLVDIRRLIKYKCLRYWVPPVSLVLEELRAASDDSAKVTSHVRRGLYLNAIRFTLQLCERIMFSLMELILWQEEGFGAAWSLEEGVHAPPPTRRYLPTRGGDIDENARTPRDEEDAELLAPGRIGPGGWDNSLGNQATSLGESAADFGMGSSMHGSMRASLRASATSGGARRLDRMAIRAAARSSISSEPRNSSAGKGGGKSSTVRSGALN